eukprot:gene29237-38305_t
METTPVLNEESIPSATFSEIEPINNVEAASTAAAATLKTEDVLFPLNSASLRIVLEEFYSLYNPERKSTISIIIDKYENNQLELFKSLKERYNIAEYKPFDDIIRIADPAQTMSSTVVDATPPTTGTRQQTQLGNNSTGIGGLSAAISLNMQDIAGVSSNLLAGTAGRLFTGVSWGLTTNNNLASTNTNTNTNSPSAKSKNGDAMEVKATRISSTESNEALAPSGSSEIDSSIVTVLTNKDDESVSEMEVINSKLKLQLAAVLKENSLLKNESTELKSKVDSLQSSLVDLLDRESVARKESLRLREQLSNCEEVNSTLKKQIETEESKSTRKHAQLLECMQMNQRLTSQLEFIVVEAHRSAVFPLQMCESSEDGYLTLAQVEADRISTAAAFKQLFSTADAADPPPPPTTPPCEISGSSVEQKLERGSEDSNYLEKLVEELSLARKRADYLHSSTMVSKLEIARAGQKEHEMLHAMLLQQAEIESLYKQLAIAKEEKENLLQQIAEHQHETQVDNERLVDSQTRLIATEKNCDNMRSELSATSIRCRQLSEQLSLMEESTRQLRDGCNNIVRANEDKCARIVRCMQERFSLEREEFFSHLRELNEVRSALLGQVQQETSADLQRLRDEAFRARRAEVQKDRQISYLQSQLKEAASRLVGSSTEQPQEKGRAT